MLTLASRAAEQGDSGLHESSSTIGKKAARKFNVTQAIVMLHGSCIGISSTHMLASLGYPCMLPG